MKKILLVILFALFIVTGCNKKVDNDVNEPKPISAEEQEKIYLNSIKNNKVENLRKEIAQTDVLGNYNKNSKYYYEEIRNIFLSENNEYAKRFKMEYEKLNYDSFSGVEKDAFDTIFKQLFYRDSIIKDVDIKNIWLIGYDNYNDSKDIDENGVGLLINFNLTTRESDTPDFDFYTYTKYYLGKNGKYIEEDYKHINVGDNLPLDITKANGKVNYKNYNYIRKGAFDSLNGKNYKKIDEETLNNLKEKIKPILDIVIKYFYDRETLIEENNFFEKSYNYSGDCGLSSGAESAVRADYQNHLSTVKSKFKTVTKCEITNLEKTGETKSDYSYKLNGSCSGYTDLYNQDYNIMTFDMKLSVNKSNCSVWGSVTNSKMKFK